MDQVSKPTAMFFGFLTAAMTQVSAQAAPVAPPAPNAVVQSAADAPATSRAAPAQTAETSKAAGPRRDRAS